MNPRAFLDEPLWIGQSVTIAGEDGHHFTRVLRVREGEDVAVASRETGYLGKVTEVDAKQAEVTIDVLHALDSHESIHKVYLVQGLPKGDKIDEILQHNTEVGVAGFLVAAAKRSVAKLDAKKAQDKVVRWQRVVREAASQSQRDIIPPVEYAGSIQAAVAWCATVRPDKVLFLDEDEHEQGLLRVLRTLPGDLCAQTIVIVVGPEGGWDDEERALWSTLPGTVSVTLGPRTLRTETAGLVAASAVFHHFGQLGG